ncbi:PH domain-containing protein [Nonlabens ponticola]|uniref:YdbS-like PH domain-containing protein n=1 Tax=Nonlabens ponticola TaxID=2496866 RepID=A0A3S9MZ65_9FLAO|nr:PH domain-containing protein [Nonlabens ponticola]AZQ44545.1 hypothetical protein EJ995_09915 [Nonlabens ponticola]
MTNENLNVINLPDVPQEEFEKHPKRFLNKKLIAKTLFMLPLLIGVIVMVFFVDTWIAVAAGSLWLLLLILVLFLAYKEYFVRGYVLREKDITYRYGWLFHHEITVPFNRIQHTEVNDGPIDRAFNLCELQIYTAGGSASDLSISGLDPMVAAKLKDFISGKATRHA